MRIQAVTNRYNHNLLTPASNNRNNMSKPSFGIRKDFDNEFCNDEVENSFDYMYEPNEPFSPQRQAIENTYGRKVAELADLAECGFVTNAEYQVRLKQIKKERTIALKRLQGN